VDGELLSYESATLTGAHQYDLDNLYRGLYSSPISSHAVGAPFARLDASVFKYDIPADYDGVVVYFKFQSYNIWGNAVQNLADCVEYTYTPEYIPPPDLILDGGNANGDLL
jgi:hypothetical protein